MQMNQLQGKYNTIQNKNGRIKNETQECIINYKMEEKLNSSSECDFIIKIKY